MTHLQPLFTVSKAHPIKAERMAWFTGATFNFHPGFTELVRAYA